MKTIPIKVWNRIEMLQQPIAVIARASAINRKRWVAIFANKHSIANQPPHIYRIVDTEFDNKLLEKYAEGWNTDFAIAKQATHYASNISELYSLLLKLKVEPESFDAPWHVNHPLL